MSSTVSRVCVNYSGLWRMLYAVLMGQLTSFSLALMCFNSSLSANLGVNAPFSLSFFAYLGITLVFGSILLYHGQKPHISWYWYVLLAFVDVQGSYLYNKSYQFSSVTSVTLLDCTTLVWVILLTWIFLGTKYSLSQFLGAAVCVTGLCLVLLSDSGVGGGGGSNPILGDALVISGTCFFAFSNVGEEFCVRKVGQIEILTFAGYGIAGFMYYSLTPLVLEVCYVFHLMKEIREKLIDSVFMNDGRVYAGKWSDTIQSVLADSRYVGCGHSCVFIPPEGGLVILRVLFTCWRRSRHIFKTVSIVLMENHNDQLPELENGGETDQLYKMLPEEEAIRVQRKSMPMSYRNSRMVRLTNCTSCYQRKPYESRVEAAMTIKLVTMCVNAPFTLVFFSYLALTLVFGSILLYRRQKLHISWYWYVLLAVVDVHGNYLFNKAYQFSSITSVTILDCATVVWVIILTWLFLGTKYSIWQFFGAALCVSGLGLVLLSDSGVGGGGGSNPILGDAIVIVGTWFFALSNVGEEFCVKKVGRVEVIAMLCLFGTLMTGVEMFIFERKNLESVSWSLEVILTFVGYGVASFTFCSLRPVVLQASGATLFNLSLLTADMWAVVIRVFLYHQKVVCANVLLGPTFNFFPFCVTLTIYSLQVDWLYYVSFLLVGIGLVIYSKPEKHTNELSELEDGDTYRALPEEESAAVTPNS
ncbi:hypothetical protein OSB04_029142 [Centaurea solstitialis]|uniref:Solute carrier family 35 member F1 n=1 Tax=Centaurea solstitialis TaxID=347529 RepID=A0AA38SU01_9ASTR|nr:hypothetical protein OSB04_029142 [Centaurea solstitialis]